MWVLFLCIIKHRNSNEKCSYLAGAGGGGGRLTLLLIPLGSASANEVQGSCSGMALWRGNHREKREKSHRKAP